MKYYNSLIFPAALVLVGSQAIADDLTWDTTIAADGTITEGAGTWTAGAGNWNDGLTSDGINWTDGDRAIFGGGAEGTAGTVTLGSDITTENAQNGLDFTAPFDGTYALDLNGFTLTTGANGQQRMIVRSGGAVQINDSVGTGAYITTALGNNRFASLSSDLTFNAKVTDADGIGTGTNGAMFITGAGSLIFTNDSNDFTGRVGKQNGGNLTLTSIADSGVASAAGAGSLVYIAFNAGLNYTGDGDSTNRTFQFGGTSGGTIRNNGSGALVWTGDFLNTTSGGAGNRTLNFRGSNTDANEFQGDLADNGDKLLKITKLDAGTWGLSGDNTYTGNTTLSAGKLNVNSATALGATASTFVINGGVVDNVSGSAITLTNNNAITIGGNFSYSTDAGTSDNDLNLGTGAVSMAANRTITLNGTGALTFGGVLTNTGDSARTLTVNNGTGTSGLSAVSFGGYELTGAASTTARTNIITGSGNVNITGAITDGVSAGSGLTKSGSGILTLSGTNTYTGATTATAGTLLTTKAAALSGYDSTGNVVFDGGTIGVQVGGSGWTSGELDDLLANATKTGGSLGIDTTNGNFTQSTGLTPTNLGVLGLTKLGANTLTLNQANTYAGTTTLAAGILQADVADVAATSGAMGNGGNITFTGGTLQYTANSASTDYSGRIVNSSSAMIFDTNGQDVTFASDLASSNSGGLVKEGAGTLVAKWANGGYTGLTVVNGGTLQLLKDSGGNSWGAGNFEINNGSRLEFNAAATAVFQNRTFTFDSNGGGTIHLTGNTILQTANNTIVTTGGTTNTVSGDRFNMQNSNQINYVVADGSDDVDLVVSVRHDRGSITKDGAGTLSLTNTTNNLLNTNTITVTAGTLEIGGAGRINNGNSSSNITNDATFKYSSSASQELAGIISGSGGIIQDNGTLTLSGDSVYTGATMVSAGILYVNGSLGDTAVSVADGASLGGTGSIAGSLDFAGLSLLDVVEISNPLEVTGNVTFGSGFGIDNITGWDLESADIDTYTLLTGNNIDFTNLDNVGLSNAFTLGNGNLAYFQSGSLQVVIIPEPSVALLGALGMLALFRRRRH